MSGGRHKRETQDGCLPRCRELVTGLSSIYHMVNDIHDDETEF